MSDPPRLRDLPEGGFARDLLRHAAPTPTLALPASLSECEFDHAGTVSRPCPRITESCAIEQRSAPALLQAVAA